MKTLYASREEVILRQAYSAVKGRHRDKNFKGAHLNFDEFCFLVYRPCYLCGHTGSNTKLDRNTHTGGLHSDTVVRVNGLDRVDNNKGYVVSNCRSCCRFCNAAKSVMTLDHFRAWVVQVHTYLHLGDDPITTAPNEMLKFTPL